MKKTSFLFKIAMVLSALVLPLSCDTGGGGGGGGNNSQKSSSTSISVTIPKASAASSDINLLGDFDSTEANNFYYEVYFKKGTKEIARKGGKPGNTVKFDNVTYDTYTFYLTIWISSNKSRELKTFEETKKISETENTVQFPDMKTSDFSSWFFVYNAEDITTALTTISNAGIYTESNKAKICLRQSIAFPESSTVTENQIIDFIPNGFELAESLFSVSITAPENGTVTPNKTKASEGTEVTLTVAPTDNYKLKWLKMNGNALTVEGGTAKFYMPSGGATITAEFCKIFKIKYTITVTGTNAFPASSSFTLYDCSTDALSESFIKDTPVAVAEDEITTTSLMKPSYSGYIASVDSTDTPYIFKGWDYDNDSTADITDTSTSAKLTEAIFEGKDAGEEVTLKAVWAEATEEADKNKAWAGIPYDTTYYNNHSEFQIWTDAQAENIFVDLNSDAYDYTGKTIELMADVSVNKGLEYFWGTFNGNNKALNVNITTSGFNGCAPFINLKTTTSIKDLTVAGNITAPANSSFVGGIAGTTSYATIENCTVTATIKGVSGHTISSDEFGVGGIAGKSFATIKNCKFSGTVQGYQNVGVGGIVGCYNSGTVQNNTVTGTIKYEGDSGSPAFDSSWSAGCGVIIGKTPNTSTNTDSVSSNTGTGATVSIAAGVPLTANTIGFNP